MPAPRCQYARAKARMSHVRESHHADHPQAKISKEEQEIQNVFASPLATRSRSTILAARNRHASP
ncbi:hypothetical protein MPTK1_2g25980 [Marchantia polymorpha subsp. ruderalis]|uniref:Uncharacterized protein n=1 Tax=Marchantia polymorpha TaxID=3197 RepID=A0A2R6XB93_MARPO|nr:hypothetical protein MARPO_0025s0080 [Marchantia polymorpha]BBN03742.1 hypothetical protein Mp_2g25980 [Marchantia polymorpha subsp. ruderalis]|eukprot:PTQ43390.1 hypothetical protein MARPO_0025s0080 [Marchantia polymorpha]